ncbi:MAG: Isochorismatase hydrolase [Geminicoccaceae bacterium]|jgi:nicotinamidase-related amidase|nr:Isochorismatase hydrolase [Geminicoccaceae bacterium]
MVLIEAARSALLVVDVQARVAPAMHRLEDCLQRCRVLIETARRLELPVPALEEYPEGLGATVPELAALLSARQIHAKRRFAATAHPEIAAAVLALGRTQIVLCGVEAHVCVLQTALGLQALGLQPIVVADAVASRRPQSRALALDRLRANGVEIVDTEMVFFEWLAEGGTAAFRALLPLIR